MLLADSNVWLALALSKHVFHTMVREWLDSQPPSDSVLFCRATQQSFLRLLTTQAVVTPYGIPPLSNKSAWSVYEGFIGNERILSAAVRNDTTFAEPAEPERARSIAAAALS